MKQIIFYARDLKTGEKFRFRLDDLYDYEGEEEGVFIRDNGIAINYNSGSAFRGMNPDLDIYDVKIIDRLS